MNERTRIRSFLFVPAANSKFLAKAAESGSDAVILDLEDGTHPSQRPAARAGLEAAYAVLKARGRKVAVRINGDLLSAVEDLRAAVRPGLDLLVLPKVEHPRDVELVSRVIGTLERDSGMEAGATRLLLQIESAAALPRLPEIAAASARAAAMMLGSEDYSLDIGAEPTPDALMHASMQVLNAARGAGLQPVGFVGSIARLGSEAEFRVLLERARALGFRGAVVVHPRYVEVVNSVYTPSPEQIAQARAVAQAFEAADALGQGAIRVGELMVDRPVYARALQTLREAG